MIIKILDKGAIGNDTPLEILSTLGEVIVYDSTDEKEIFERVCDADVLVFNKVKITKDVIESAKSLKLLCVFATGYDNIDLEAAKANGVAVCNVPAYSTESVTLFTIATVTALITNLREYSDFVRSGKYSSSGLPNRITPVYHEIAGKTWGIIGYGNIGKSVAKVAEALGAKVIVARNNNKGAEIERTISELCMESDIITVHCPLTEKTRGVINESTIAQMKPGVILVNEARGAVLNENDVKDAVLSGKIAAFGCDVYSKEPFPAEHPYSAIKELPNVILTPHAAWASYEARKRCTEIIKSNIEAFFAGERKNRIV